MAVTCGFFNALEHDRLYDAIQMSSIFDGIIRDGIFSTIGTSMAVTASGNGLIVNVGAGRAWFNHTWILNDTAYPVEAEAAEVVLDRIDAVVIEVNSSVEVRDCSIKFIKGTPSSRPERPTMIHNAEINQYALAYVSIRAGQTTIFQADITSVIGNDETPYITGLLQQTSIESIVAQWQDEFYTYFNNFRTTTTTDFNNWMSARVAEYNAWYASMEAEGQADLAEFDSWFQEMKDQLSEDAAGHLQAEIDALELSAEKGSVVTVTTSNDTLINRACTITQGSSVRTATFDVNKVAKFESVPFVGDMHISATNGVLIASKDITIPYFGRYEHNIEFWEATLDISNSTSELYGRSITISRGGAIVGTTSFDNTGHATFKVHEPGTYTVTSTTTGGDSFTTDVVVTEETSYPVDLGMPIGATATPTDSIQTWLACGSKYGYNYTTIAQVMNDTELFSDLCADSNACDYMARSTTWASNVAGDAKAMHIVGLYDYCANKLLSNATWCEAIAGSSYFESVLNVKVPTMTSDTTPEGECFGDYPNNTNYARWKAFDNNSGTLYQTGTKTCKIGYKFVNPVVINKVSLLTTDGWRVKTGTIDASNNGTDWVTIKNVNLEDASNPYISLSNDTPYLYYRLNVTESYGASLVVLYELQFYGRADSSRYVPLIPNMTSNTTPSGICSAKTAMSGYEAYKAFDGNESSYYEGTSAASADYNDWLKYEFASAIRATAFRLKINVQSVASAAGITKKYKIQGSNDNSTWKDLYVGGFINNIGDIEIQANFTSNIDAYKYYRVIMDTMFVTGVSSYGVNTFQLLKESTLQTIHSAANDTIYYLDGQTPVTVAVTDANGVGEIDLESLGDGAHTLYSTVAKNPTSPSNPYSKTINVTRYTTEVYLMPIGAIYWYGFKSPLALSDLTSRMTFSYRQDAANPSYNATKNTNSVVFDVWYPYTGEGFGHTTQEEITGTIGLTGFSHAKSIVAVNNSQYAREIVTGGPYTAYPNIYFGTTPATIAYDDTFSDGLFDVDISSINSGVIAYMHYSDGTYMKHCTLTLKASWLE